MTRDRVFELPGLMEPTVFGPASVSDRWLRFGELGVEQVGAKCVDLAAQRQTRALSVPASSTVELALAEPVAVDTGASERAAAR